MRTHPGVGAEIIGLVPNLQLLAPLIRSHHEWWNGTGYPDGSAGENMPLGARIIAVADAFHARTTVRPYQEAREPDWALKELQRAAGTQFDPAVVDAFAQLHAAASSADGHAHAS